jgi:hypothetical protein
MQEDSLVNLRLAFEKLNPDFEKHKWFTQRMFNKWMKLYAKYHTDIENTSVRKTNGVQMVQFTICEKKMAEIKAKKEWYE